MWKYIDKSRKLKTATEKAAFRNIGHAAASIRKDAISSIKRRVGPSQPGQPPHTRKTKRGNARFKQAILYQADDHSAIIGFRHSVVGESAAIHEFGETIKGVSFPERPTMGPALERGAPRFGNSWRSSIG